MSTSRPMPMVELRSVLERLSKYPLLDEASDVMPSLNGKANQRLILSKARARS